MTTLTIRKPDDFHLHLRQGEPMKEYARVSADSFARALVMPNTLPPVTDPEGLNRYRNAIRDAAPGLEPLMTFKILPGMDPREIAPLKEAGALAGKLYPAGATTNAEDGVRSSGEIEEVLAAMEEAGLVLSIHGERPDAPVLEREARYLPELEEIISRHSRLKVVLEHISCRESLDCLNSLPETVGATVTVHHLLYTLDDLMGGALQPHLFCKPVVKTEEDRTALAEAVTGGHPRLFFGSDSAPHPRDRKECGGASAGSFTAPAALPLLAELFERYGALDKLEDFVSVRGARFYGVPVNKETLTLVREPWRVPDLIGGAVPLLAGRDTAWKVLA